MKKIIQIKDADKEDGGSGAYDIYLKRKKNKNKKYRFTWLYTWWS